MMGGKISVVWGITIILVGHLNSAPRKVLAEMFTNTSCPPCAYADPALDQIVENHSGIMTCIRYHTWWPSSQDPYYQANPTENQQRVNYYGTNYVPRLMVDGAIDGGYQYSAWENLILLRSQTPSPIVLTLSITYDPSTRSGIVRAVVYAEGSANYNALKLRYVIIENNIYWPAPNGVVWHHQTMRDMIPNAGGVLVNITQGQTFVDSQPFTINPNWVAENCQIVVFVQNDVTREVYQSEVIGVVTSVEENALRFKPQIYLSSPLSFSGSFKLNLQLQSPDVIKFEVYSPEARLVGSTVKHFEPGSHTFTLPLDWFKTKGIFLLNIKSHNKLLKTFKLVKIN